MNLAALEFPRELPAFLLVFHSFLRILLGRISRGDYATSRRVTCSQELQQAIHYSHSFFDDVLVVEPVVVEEVEQNIEHVELDHELCFEGIGLANQFVLDNVQNPKIMFLIVHVVGTNLLLEEVSELARKVLEVLRKLARISIHIHINLTTLSILSFTQWRIVLIIHIKDLVIIQIIF